MLCAKLQTVERFLFCELSRFRRRSWFLLFSLGLAFVLCWMTLVILVFRCLFLLYRLWSLSGECHRPHSYYSYSSEFTY
ncbi:hypothetical protein AKJ16_DCAP27036, partial [Drosera capensis]